MVHERAAWLFCCFAAPNVSCTGILLSFRRELFLWFSCCCLLQMREEGDQLLLTAQPALPLVPGLAAYTEYYNKDGSPASWTLRRDVSIGKTTGQMFMTTDGILIFR